MTNTLYLPELREMLAASNEAELREFCSALHPARTAEFMEGLSAAESWQVLRHADPATRARIFAYFDLEKQIQSIESIDRNDMVHLVTDLAPDERVDILNAVDPQIRDSILTLLPVEERRNILRLSTYPDGTAGAVMTTQFARLSEAWTVGHALDELRRLKEELETIYYLYVVDDGDHLRGLVSLRELVFARPEQRIGELMERAVVQVDVLEDQEEVADKMAQYDFLAIPVVDHERHLVGIITYDDVIDVVREEATEDAQRSAGVQPFAESYMQASLRSVTWKRGVWLVALFFVSLGTSWTLAQYEHVVAQIPWLVMFIPLVISTGGNCGSQSAALIISALSTGDVTFRDWARVVRREIALGLLLGGQLAVLGFFAAYFAAPSLLGAFVLPLTVITVVVAGTLTGSLLPLLFSRLGWDPALMSNPMVACIIDFLGTVIYMTVALTMLGVTRPG